MILISGDTANSKTQALLANSGVPLSRNRFVLKN